MTSLWTPERGDWHEALQTYERDGSPMHLDHGSPEWHAARRTTHVSATQIRDALGLGYEGASLASVYHYRATGEGPEPSWLMRLGQVAEPALLAHWSHGACGAGGAWERGGVMASLDGTIGMIPVEAKLRQVWGENPYSDGGATEGEVCQLQVQCWVMGAPAGILVVARGADVYTSWVRHPEGEAMARIHAAAEAIRRADREGWSAVADWLLREDDWKTYREIGAVTEPRYAPELAPVVDEIQECEALLSSARSEVRTLERRREVAYCRLSVGGEAEIDVGGRVVAPVYRSGKLSGWKVQK